MQLILIGVIFMVGLLLYYIFSTSGGSDEEQPEKKKPDDDLRQEENVIYLSDDIDKIKRNHNIGGKEQ